MKNLVLIGLPGCGKTTVGQRFAASWGLPFVDVDAAIETRYGQPISAIFAQLGETGFRKLERDMVAELSRREGHVIATGGGVTEAATNVTALRKNGVLVWIDRPVEAIAEDVDTRHRPLLRDGAQALLALSARRREGYREAAHFVLPNLTSAECCHDALVRLLCRPDDSLGAGCTIPDPANLSPGGEFLDAGHAEPDPQRLSPKHGNPLGAGYVVIGAPIAHSRSPFLHNTVLAHLGRSSDYAAMEVFPAELPGFVALARQTLRGFNVTMPHKTAILPLLDAVSPQARACGSVNTVVNDDGRLIGHNTDMIGLAMALGNRFLGSRAALSDAADDNEISEPHAGVSGAGARANGFSTTHTATPGMAADTNVFPATFTARPGANDFSAAHTARPEAEAGAHGLSASCTSPPGAGARVNGFSGTHTAILGAGGAALAAAMQAAADGAAQITLYARNPEKAQGCAARVRAAYPNAAIGVGSLDALGTGPPEGGVGVGSLREVGTDSPGGVDAGSPDGTGVGSPDAFCVGSLSEVGTGSPGGVVPYDLLINATPLGMAGARVTQDMKSEEHPANTLGGRCTANTEGAKGITRVADPEGAPSFPDFDDFSFLHNVHPDGLVMDMIYQPPQTRLLQAARALGLRTQNGLAMLAAQALAADALFFEAAGLPTPDMPSSLEVLPSRGTPPPLEVLPSLGVLLSALASGAGGGSG